MSDYKPPFHNKGELMKILLADLHRIYGYSGGIESVLAHMAGAFCARGHEVIAVFADEKAEGDCFFSFPPAARLYDLYHMEGYPVLAKASGQKFLREIVRPFSRAAARNENYKILARTKDRLAAILETEAPDIIISFREPTGRLLLGGIQTTIPVISMQHSSPGEIYFGVPEEEKKALEKSTRIQVFFPSFVEETKKYLHYDRFTVIPNAVQLPKVCADVGGEKEMHIITCVGRLTGRTKRQHLLIEAFSQIAKQFPTWQVKLWGDTYDKPYVAALKAQIAKAGLVNRVHLCGTTKDLAAVWQETDIFAFPSHHEGFGMALVEAMGAGIPAVGYRSCAAVNELIRDQETGILCEEGTEPLAKALATLMKNPMLRKRYGDNAKEAAMAYEAEHVWDMWENVLQEVKREYK